MSSRLSEAHGEISADEGDVSTTLDMTEGGVTLDITRGRYDRWRGESLLALELDDLAGIRAKPDHLGRCYLLDNS